MWQKCLDSELSNGLISLKHLRMSEIFWHRDKRHTVEQINRKKKNKNGTKQQNEIALSESLSHSSGVASRAQHT